MEKKYSTCLGCLVFIYPSLKIIKNMILLALNCSKFMNIFTHQNNYFSFVVYLRINYY